MAIWLAAGPCGTISSVTTVPSSRVIGSTKETVSYDLKFWTTPWDTNTKESTTESGINTYNIDLVISVQKFPIPFAFTLKNPLINANNTHIPTAGETKFWTVSPIICVK